MDCNSAYTDRSVSAWKRFQQIMGELRLLLLFLERIGMRYHYEKPTTYSTIYGSTYVCNHPVYSRCTLFKINSKGLAVIQQRYDIETKITYWTEIDPWLIDELYLHIKFEELFNERAGEGKDGLYPTVTIRQIMWGLKMKPLAREQWETCFDRRLV